ncbi:MAG: cyclase family protein [Oscillospiraceae bacterium]|nr:cyclase family protein [Oscillospiraceae bacterium]
MKRVIDITGVIKEGMWNYDAPFPSIQIKPLPPIPWLGGKTVGAEIFEGLHSQTGTYLETPAHNYGNGNSYALIDVPVEKLIDIPCVVLNVGMFDMDPSAGRRPITARHLEQCFNAAYIQPNDAIIIGTGWGRYWFHPDNLKYAPYLTKEAMDWIIEKKPFLLGSDITRWENLEKPEGFFDDFYAANILMAGPFVDLELCKAPKCRLTVLPPKFAITSCAPSRAVIIEDREA